MSAPAWDVVILTEDRYLKPDPADWYQAQIQTEDGLLAQACANRGLSVSRASWSDPAFPWEKARCALFRSTWDYFARIDEFGPWLERVAARTRLYNPAALIRWNLDKRYLAELAEAGTAVVPTRYAAVGEGYHGRGGLARGGLQAGGIGRGTAHLPGEPRHLGRA